MVTLRKTTRPLHTMTIDDLYDLANANERISIVATRRGMHSVASSSLAMAMHCDSEIARRL